MVRAYSLTALGFFSCPLHGATALSSTITNIRNHLSFAYNRPVPTFVKNSAIVYLGTFIPTALHYIGHGIVDAWFTGELPKGLVLGQHEEPSYTITKPFTLGLPPRFPLPVPLWGFIECSEKSLTRLQDGLKAFTGPVAGAVTALSLSHLVSRMPNRFLTNYFHALAHHQLSCLLPFGSDGTKIYNNIRISPAVHVISCAALHYLAYRYAPKF